MPAVLGWVLGALAVVVPVVIYFKERRTQGIQYSVLDTRPLVTSATNFPLQISHRGVAVQDPALVIWRLTNAGNHPVRPEDFEEPLTFLVEGARILSSDITFSRPSEFAPAIVSRGEATVVLDSRLMNARDLVEVQMLVDGRPSKTTLTGRVAGISVMEKVNLPRTSWGQVWKFSWFDRLAVILMGIGGAALGVWFLFQSEWYARALGLVMIVVFAVYYPFTIRKAMVKNSLFLGG